MGMTIEDLIKAMWKLDEKLKYFVQCSPTYQYSGLENDWNKLFVSVLNLQRLQSQPEQSLERGKD